MANGIIDVIKYEGDNKTLIFKHPKEDFNLGSQLIVHESQEAVFFRNGEALETLGAGRHTLETQNLPFLKKVINKVAGGENVFHSEVYFINLTTELGIRWGTDSKINMFDPISGLHIQIGASGTFNIKVNNGRKLLLKVVGTTNGFKQEELFGMVGYSTTTAIGSFRGMIVSKVKSYLAKAIRENDINILEIDEHLDELSEVLRIEINKVFDDYGMIIPEFHITAIVLPEPGENPNFDRLKEQQGQRYILAEQARIARAAGEVELAEKTAHATAGAEALKITAAGEAEAEKVKGFAHAEVLRAQGGNYQTETARVVGKAAAENESSGGASGIASDVIKAGVGIGVGVSVAKEMAGSVKEVVNGSNAQTPQESSWVCPNCHHANNRGRFCEECGTKRPEIEWTCPECGQQGLKGKFCQNCGHKREE